MDVFIPTSYPVFSFVHDCSFNFNWWTL